MPRGKNPSKNSISEPIKSESQPVIMASESNSNIVNIEGNPTLVKDMTSHAILNRDRSAYHAALRARQYDTHQKNTIKDLSTRISQLEELITNFIKKSSSKSQ